MSADQAAFRPAGLAVVLSYAAIGIAHHLALAVPHSIHSRSPYDFAINLISALYAREVPQRHARGILVVGY
jgi:hypothetical protein